MNFSVSFIIWRIYFYFRYFRDQKEYKDLANNLSNYLVSLLDKVWTQSELEVVLNKDESAEADKNENLSRLRMAIDQREKKVRQTGSTL